MTEQTAKVKSNQMRNAVILAGVVMGCLVFFIYMISNSSNKAVEVKSDKDHFASPLEHIDAESALVENTQKELQESHKQIDGLKNNLESLMNRMISEQQKEENTNGDLVKRMIAVEKQLVDLSHPESTTENGSGEASDEFPEAYNQGPRKGQAIREDSLSLETKERSEDKKPIRNPDSYVPAGSFVRAVMVGGADAAASVNAQANPVPMLFRLTAEGTLPNHQKSHLKDCFVTAAVVGDISSERGQIRTESLSCVFSNGTVVDQPVEGTVFGPDGKNAVRGHKYEGGGEHVASATFSGFFSGLSKGVSETYTTNSISSLGNVSTANPGKIFQNGITSGTSKGLEQVADYEMRRADQYHSIIQLSAGTEVDIVFLKGFYLDGKKHEIHDNTVENFTHSANTEPSLFPTPPTDSPPLSLGAKK